MSSLDISGTAITVEVADAAEPGCSRRTEEPQLQHTEKSTERLATGTGSGRNRPLRASKSECLLKINRRSLMKPQRKGASVLKEDCDEEEIKKFYLNNKIVNLKPNHLETIFEEPTTVRNEMRLVGLKKIKRSINFKDHLNITKTTLQSRRKKIKHLFGGTTGKKFNKLSMDAFLQRLQTVSDPIPSLHTDIM